MVIRNKYRVYHFGGRDILAVPHGARMLRAAGVSCIPAATLRARAFQLGLRGLVATGWDAVITHTSDTPVPILPGFRWAEFIGEMERALGCDDLLPVVLQPRQRSRSRVYIHLFSPAGERIAFAKVATDATSAMCLEREIDVLRRLMSRTLETFRFPSLLASGEFNHCRYALLAPLPTRASSHPPVWTEHLSHIQAEVAREMQDLSLSSAPNATWWRGFERVSHVVPQLAEELGRDVGTPFECAGVHGDFVNWNIYVNGEDHWLFDWEAWAPDGPLLADEVRFKLGIHTRSLESAGHRVVPALLRELGCADRARRRDVALALAFLHSRATTSATILASHWGEGPRA